MDVFPDPIRRFVAAAGPPPTELQREMARYGRDEDFPFLGPELGGLVSIFTRMVGASRVFEFGSGFGYSASWFLRGLPPEGEIVLTEIDEDEAAKGRHFLERMDTEARFTYEVGDALDVVERYDGPFDAVLIDHQKERYVEAFEAVAGKVAPGGIVIADNMMRGPFDFDDVLAGLEGASEEFDSKTQGVIDYVERVRDVPEFDSGVIPVGSGISISHKER